MVLNIARYKLKLKNAIANMKKIMIFIKLKMIFLFIGVYATYDLYRYIKNWCEDNEINDFLKNKIKLK